MSFIHCRGNPAPSPGAGLVVAALLLAAGVLAGPKPAQPHPNILVIMAGDLAAWHLGCYGNRAIRTPNLDRLAAEGVRMTHAYGHTPVCAYSASARCFCFSLFLEKRYGEPIVQVVFGRMVRLPPQGLHRNPAGEMLAVRAGIPLPRVVRADMRCLLGVSRAAGCAWFANECSDAVGNHPRLYYKPFAEPSLPARHCCTGGHHVR